MSVTPTSPNVQRARRFVLPALLGLLALSIAGNVTFAWLWTREARASHAMRLDPGQLDYYEAERAHPPADGKPVVVFFGDSRALMWPEPKGLSDYAVVNRGVGFQTTAQILLRLDQDVAPLHPAVVVLQAGVNDLKTIADAPESRAWVVRECEDNLRTIVTRLKATGAKVVVTSVFDMGTIPIWRKPFWSDEVQAAIHDVNGFLPSLAGEQVTLVDTAATLDDESGRVKRGFQADFIHENAAAYAALDEKVVPLVRGLVAR